MDDQFSEWDVFYETYERALTADEAMGRYKRLRRRRERAGAARDRERAKSPTIAQKKVFRLSAQLREEAVKACETKTSSESEKTKSD